MRSSLVVATSARAVSRWSSFEHGSVARVAGVDGDPGGPRRGHEPAVVADLDRDDRHAPGHQPERDAVPDRAKSGDDHVVADVARDRPAAERLEQPRADQRVGDERVDDRDDRGADEAQEDGVDPQRDVVAGGVHVRGERRAGQQRDRVRDRVQRPEAGFELEEDRRGHREAEQDRRELHETPLRRRHAVADRRARTPDRAPGRRRGHLVDDLLRVLRGGDVDQDQAGLTRVRVGQQLDRAVGGEAGDGDGRPATRRRARMAARDQASAQPEAAPRLAVDGRRDEAGRRQRGRRERDRVVEELRDVGPELLVEEADHDTDPRVDLRGGERRVQVAEIVVAGQHDHAGVLDVGGAQRLREPMVADDQPDAVLGQPFLGVGGRADGDDLLVAEAQLLDRPKPQVVDAADDRMAVGWLRAGRRHGGQSMRQRAGRMARCATPGVSSRPVGP